MTNVLAFALVGLLNFGGGEPIQGKSVAWQQASLFDVPTQTDPVITEIIEEYLTRLERLGYQRDRQGIWLQSEWAYLAHNQEEKLLPVASLTKVATSLAALEVLGIEHQFVTRFYATGPIENGVLTGDLVVEAGGNPLLVWEEAIAIGNVLNQLGIESISGDLVIVGDLAMNFQEKTAVSGGLLQQAMNQKQWSGVVETAFAEMPAGTPRPNVILQGTIRQADQVPTAVTPLLNHQSPSLGHLLKQMNIYSNNKMADALADAAGGTSVVTQTVSRLASIPASEIQLVNGSGLSPENQMSPKAVARLYQALSTQLAPQNLNIDDIFPVMGRDKKGTLEWRSMPEGLAVKTGSLNQVSALAGTIPTRERGTVWFTLVNSGTGVNWGQLRREQDRVLKQIAQHWQVLPEDLTPSDLDTIILGDPDRVTLPVVSNASTN